jgi:O-antigen/teichoic acid export membrane protein
LYEEGDVYMNFDTKYLVRWGIPGWILIMILGPFIFFHYQEDVLEIVKTINPLALGAFLTILGVPLGYLLNQIHHSLFWVFRLFKFSTKIKRQDGWYDYFNKEIQVDNLFYNANTSEEIEISKMKRERYRYLLSRKHELGGLMVSLFIATLVIIGIIIFKGYVRESWSLWSWIYFIVTFILFGLISLSRWYSSKNIDKYFEELLKEANRS